MRFKVLSLLVVLACAVLLVAPAIAADGNANFVLGERWMSSSSDWQPWDDQAMGGVTVDFGGANWPVHLETGAEGSAKTVSTYLGDVTGSVGDVFFGVNKTWSTGRGNVHPYVGGGIASVTAKMETGSVSVDDTSVGFYVHGGVFWRLGTRFNIGFDVRALGGTNMSIEGVEFDSNFTQVGLVLGWGWPKSK